MNDDSTLLYRLWGKTNEPDIRKGKADTWRMHPAICHMVDVGYVAETWLTANERLMDRFSSLAPGIERQALKKIIVSITAIHDLGKLHRSFQSKSEAGWVYGYGKSGRKRDTRCKGFDHGRATGIIMRDLFKKERRGWKAWRKAFDAVSGHHGKLYTSDELRDNDALSFPSYIDEKPLVIEALDTLSELFSMPDELPEAPQSNAFFMLLAGFASVADWLGSNSELYAFRSTGISGRDDLHDYVNNLRASGIGLDQLRDAGLLPSFVSGSFDYVDLFPIITPDTIRPLQSLSRSVPFGESSGGEVAVVEAPMGMGKTEIALYLASRAITHGHTDGLYFALPTQASSNALLDRISSFADAMRDPDGELSLVLAHGGRRYNEKYRGLVDRTRKQRWQYEQTRERTGAYRDNVDAIPSEVVAPDWLQSSKRTLLAGIGVGTIDQALLGGIEVRHAFVRLFALSNKVVVFDEIHAYDAYMNEIILHLLKWLHAFGAKVILLSATLPRGLRASLLSTYRYSAETSLTAPEDDPYPQILHVDGNGSFTAHALSREVADEEKPKPIGIEYVSIPNDERSTAGADIALDLAAKGGCIAWIRNTVREAQEAWRTVHERAESRGMDDVDIRLIHARFTRLDRNRIEEELIERLGKDAAENRPRKMILIATQVIEQSVDIDFDAMISDLAPVDLLLQRLGRMWRHERDSSERQGHGSAVLHVLTPTDEEHRRLDFGSSVWVYDPEILARSSILVGADPRWELPRDCRRLVALLYDHEEQWTPEYLRVDADSLATCRSKRLAVTGDSQGKARAISMPDPTDRRLEMRDAYRDDDKGERVQLTTRVGGASATVVLLEEHDGEIRFAGSDISITPLPEPDQYARLFAIEEALLLSSVSFPWWSRLDPDPEADERIRTLDGWWRERRPYDNKVFLLLDEEGRFTHPQVIGRYPIMGIERVATEGLVVSKSHSSDEDNRELE